MILTATVKLTRRCRIRIPPHVVYLGDGAGQFTGSAIIQGSYTYFIAVGDLNNDYKQDLLYANTVQSVGILLGDGTGSFSIGQRLDVGVLPRQMVIGDFNSDGKADFATVTDFESNLSIFFADATGTFTTPVVLHVDGSPAALLSGDFNHDGKLDLAITATTVSTVLILINNGTVNTAETAVGTIPRFIASGDFDGDGELDCGC